MYFCSGSAPATSLPSSPVPIGLACPDANAAIWLLRAIIVETFAALGTAQVLERLDAAQIANARMNDMAGLWAHPQLQARERWRDVGSPAGSIPALLPPGRQSAFDYRMDPIPAVGQHTEAILRSLGRSAADIDALRATEAI